MTFNRRAFLGLLVTPRAAGAQPAEKVYRLGTLNLGAPPLSAMPDARRDVVQVLRDLGYVESRNLEVERRYAEGRAERLPALAAELVRRQVDVIVAAGSAAVQAAQGATRTIPIVINIAGQDTVELGLTLSLARPGGNVTGVVLGSVLAGKRLELLKQAVPRATRIAMLSTGDAAFRSQVTEAEQAAAVLGVRLIVVEAKGRDYERAFTTMRGERAEALFVGASPTLHGDRRRIIELAAQYRLPAIYQWAEHVEEGGLMAYGASLRWVTRLVATYVDRVFKGANPAEMPIEQATTLTLAFNLKTAKALGLTIPQTLLQRADQVIE
jgi:putative tryptophan/tyrosine transport system substrate-binding protein